jgi:oxygen-independent coproporphyrinogen III oxidase
MTGMHHLTPAAAYVHIPFCAHHCGYCDFAVTAGNDHLATLYLEALGMELATLGKPATMTTLFIGGGTPTYLPPQQLQTLTDLLRRWLPVKPGGEWSIEATPETIDDARVEILCSAGVNRVSLGVQSFQGHLLTRLDRIHQPHHVRPAIDRLTRAGLEVSLDLIFGIPEQTPDEWLCDLRTAIDLGIRHISTYGLTYEKGTPLWKQRERGEVQAIADDRELEMYLAAIDLLEAAGFGHYEISNFAKPGAECRHNQVYWANHAYHGFGVGAARYVNGSRELNRRNTDDYIRKVLAGESPTFQAETLPPEERARETIAVQLRRACGVERTPFRDQTGFELDALLQGRDLFYRDEGLLESDPRGVRLTRRGKCVADSLNVKLAWG